jgi:hypothetical protein
MLPKSSPQVKKMYFKVETPNGPSKVFQHQAFQLVDCQEYTLIHYLGDSDAFEALPHRGSKEDREYVRTLPSYMEELKQKAVAPQLPSATYKKEVAMAGIDTTYLAIKAPRNIKQLRNLRYSLRHSSRLGPDSLYNLHALAYEVGGFVRQITTFPDLEVVFGMEELLEDMQRELQLNAPRQVVSYDTTFQLGNFYLSFAIYRLTIFKGEPCIPALFLLHERKFARTHRTFFRHLKEVIPGNCRVSIVTDRERAITTAITAEVPSLPQVFCWNHIFRDVRNWLVKHGATRKEIPLITSQLRTLFCQPSQQDYERKLGELKGVWSDPFREYYFQHIHKEVDMGIGRWRLESLGLYYGDSGITNNMSESLNRVVKALQNWKEAPVDAMVTALYQLQQYFINEIQRGMAGIGEYHLKPEYLNLKKDIQDLELVQALSIDELLQQMRQTATAYHNVEPTPIFSAESSHSLRPEGTHESIPATPSPSSPLSGTSRPVPASPLTPSLPCPPTNGASLSVPASPLPPSSPSPPPNITSLSVLATPLPPSSPRPPQEGFSVLSSTTSLPSSTSGHSLSGASLAGLQSQAMSTASSTLILDRDTTQQMDSSDMLAWTVNRKDRVSFDPHLKVFNVKGVSGTVRVVSLQPTATCSCPSVGECYHIKAIKEIVGLPRASNARNLTKLKRNARPKKLKSGRKRPRIADLDPVDRQQMATPTSPNPSPSLQKTTALDLTTLPLKCSSWQDTNRDPEEVPDAVKSCCINSDSLHGFDAEKNSWSRTFAKEEVDSAVKAVSQENCFTQYIYAQGHDLIDVLSGHDLSGESVDSFLAMVAAKAKQTGIEVYPVCHKYYTFMATENYIANQWIPEDGLASYSHVLVPIVANRHWTLGVIKCSNKSIFMMDSVNTSWNSKQTAIVKEFAQAAFPGEDNWSIDMAKGVPRQRGAHDCGVFVVMYALYTVMAQQMDFTTDDMTRIRLWLTVMLVRHKDHPEIQRVMKTCRQHPMLKRKLKTSNNKAPPVVTPQKVPSTSHVVPEVAPTE